MSSANDNVLTEDYDIVGAAEAITAHAASESLVPAYA